MWAKLDDSFLDHPKVLELGDEAPEALYMWLGGLCYASRYLTDGRVPAGMIQRLTTLEPERATAAVVALIRVGLWEQDASGGFRIHDFLDFNPPRLKVLEDRARWHERAKKAAAARWSESNPLADEPMPASMQPGMPEAMLATNGASDAPVPVPVPSRDSGPGTVPTDPSKPDVSATYRELTGRRRLNTTIAEWIGDLVGSHGAIAVDRAMRADGSPREHGFMERVRSRLLAQRPSERAPTFEEQAAGIAARMKRGEKVVLDEYLPEVQTIVRKQLAEAAAT